MTWWFWAAATRHKQLHEAYMLCKEARASAFQDLARTYIEQSCDLAQRTIGPAALRAALSAGVGTDGDALVREIRHLEASIAFMEAVGANRVGAVADWSMTALAQTIDALENGADKPDSSPSPEEIIIESNKIIDFIVAIGWERT